MQFEGLREVDQRARQFEETYPAQSQLFQDIRAVPNEVFSYAHKVERMNYSSQNIQFPPGNLYPTPPNAFGGGYHQTPPPNASGGGYHQTPPAYADAYHQTPPAAGGYHMASWADYASSSQTRFGQPNMGFYTPNMNYPLYNASPSMFAPDQVHHPFPHPRQTTPVPMQQYDMPSTSGVQDTYLGNDEHDDDEERPLGRRNRRRPRCGTGSHR